MGWSEKKSSEKIITRLLFFCFSFILLSASFIIVSVGCTKKEGAKTKVEQKQAKEQQQKPPQPQEQVQKQKETVQVQVSGGTTTPKEKGGEVETKEIQKSELGLEPKSETQPPPQPQQQTQQQPDVSRTPSRQPKMYPSEVFKEFGRIDEAIQNKLSQLSISSKISPIVFSGEKTKMDITTEFGISSICSLVGVVRTEIVITIVNEAITKEEKYNKISSCLSSESFFIRVPQQDGVYGVYADYIVYGANNFDVQSNKEIVEEFISGGGEVFYIYITQDDFLTALGKEIYISAGRKKGGNWERSSIIKTASGTIYKSGGEVFGVVEQLGSKLNVTDEVYTSYFIAYIKNEDFLGVIVVDRTPPRLEVSNIPQFTDKSAILIRGKVYDNTKVKVMVNGKEAYVEGNRFEAVVSLVPGLNTINIIAVDVGGNKGRFSAVVDMVDFERYFENFVRAMEEGDKLSEAMWEGEIIKRARIFKDKLLRKADNSEGEEKLLALYLVAKSGLMMKSYDMRFVRSFGGGKLSDKAAYVVANLDATDRNVYDNLGGINIFSYAAGARSRTYVDWILRRYLGGDEDMREILIRVDREALADVVSRYIREENIDKLAKVVGYIKDEGVKGAIVEEILDSNLDEGKKVELVGKVGGSKGCKILRDYLINSKGDLAQIGKDYVRRGCPKLEGVDLTSAKSDEGYVVLGWVFLKMGEREKVGGFEYNRLMGVRDEEVLKMGIEVILSVYVSESEEILIRLFEGIEDWELRKVIVRVLGNIGGVRSLSYLEGFLGGSGGGEAMPYGLVVEISSAVERLKQKLNNK